MIETAKEELNRKIAAELPEQTKRLAFYQGISVVILGFMAYLFNNGYYTGAGLWIGMFSASMFLALFLMSAIYSSGSKYPLGICKNYEQWLEAKYPGDIPVLSVQKDLLRQYQRSINDINKIIRRRGEALKTMNYLMIVAVIIGCMGL